MDCVCIAPDQTTLCVCLPLQPLDEANLAELKVALNGFLQKGETLKLETKVGKESRDQV